MDLHGERYTRIKPTDSKSAFASHFTRTSHSTDSQDSINHRLKNTADLSCVQSFPESLVETWDNPRVVFFSKTPTEFNLAEYSLSTY